MKLHAIQYDIAWENRATNIATVRRLVSAARPPEGSLLALPEMGLTGFSMRVERVADSPDVRESEQAWRDIAREFRCWVIGGAVTRAADGRGQNEAVLAAPDGSLAARYVKMHPFTLAHEEQHYAPGAEPLVLDCGEFRAAPFVCYDLRFPEIFRTAARRGAQLIVVIANWLEARHEHWRVLLRARAIENQAWVVGVNRVGRDPKHAYLGGSMIIDPAGRVAAEAGADEGVIAAEANLAAVETARANFSALRDLRPEWTVG